MTLQRMALFAALAVSMVAHHAMDVQGSLPPKRADALPHADTGSTRDAGHHDTAPWRIGPFIAIAPGSSASSALGHTPGRTSLFLGVWAETPVLRAGPLHLSYVVQALPLVVIRGRAVPDGYNGPRVQGGLLPGPDRAYAVGLSPFGLELATPTEQRLALYGAAAAGGLVFTRPFPVPEGTHINFTLEYGGGVLVRAGRARWVQLGYKFHHISNAYLSDFNPGLAADVFYAGYQWAVQLPR